MPLTKLQFRPGINKEGTSYSNEGGYYNCDKVRFRSGYAEKLGGWVTLSSGFIGSACSIWNWVTYTAAADLLALGTGQKYYIENSGIFHDITPLRSSSAMSANPFATVIGSRNVTVTHSSHGVTVGAYVTYSSATDFNGITFNAEFPVVAVTNANTYIILAPSTATGTGTGGGTPNAAYQINPGNTTYTTGVGWGVPGWGLGGWGSATAAGIPPRLWSQDIYEDDLILAYTGGDIYYWEANTTTYPRAVTLQSYIDNSAPAKTTRDASLGDITFASGAGTITVTSTDNIVRGAHITGTGIQDDTYVDITWDFGLSIPITKTTTATQSGIYNFSYGGQHAPNRTNYVIASDTSHFTIALGSKPYDPENFNPAYDPMLVRWSDQDNPYEWVPEVTNQAGEQHLSNGSYLICAQNSRQEILVWSDAALYSMQYLGPPYVWGFNLIGDNTSIISPNAAIAVNTVTYWMGVDKFYMYNGRLETLSCTIWKYIYDNLNKTQAHQVVCGSNEGFSEIWWHYPSTASLVNDSYVIFNYLENTWYYGTLRRSVWLDSPIRQYPMGVFSVKNSNLSVDITDTSTEINLTDATTYPTEGTVIVESEQITYTGVSGNTLTGCIRGANGTTAAAHAVYIPVTYGIANQVMFHEKGNDDCSGSIPVPIEAYLESSDFDIGDGHNFGFVWRVIPDITFRGSTAGNPSVTLSVKSRINSGSGYTNAFTDPTNVTRTSTAPVEQYTGQVYLRARGRQAAFRVESSETNVAWQVGAMRIDIRQDGRR